jgi:hypothetical protein
MDAGNNVSLVFGHLCVIVDFLSFIASRIHEGLKWNARIF